ncbi:MAG: hypothetical protein QF721_01455 [Verrucomicrobiota bacterium]|nr:hypothetical protein [Verrucomicrobiota bacterium]
MNFAINRHVFASVDRFASGNGVTIYSEDLQMGVTANAVSDLPKGRLDFLQAFVRRLVPEDESILLVTESDVPAGAGLGGSGALGVAVVAALDHAFGQIRTPSETARIANEIERKDLGYPGGSQDSYAAALGGINKLEYTRGGGVVHRTLKLSNDTLMELEHNSLMIYTSEAHVSGNIHKDILDSYGLKDSTTFTALLSLRDAANSMAMALECGDMVGYIDNLNLSCESLYRLHNSCDSIAHRKYCRDLEEHILGRKTCGAGGGGGMVVYTRPGHRRACILLAREMGGEVWPVTLDFKGVATWSGKSTSKGLFEKIVSRCR